MILDVNIKTTLKGEGSEGSEGSGRALPSGGKYSDETVENSDKEKEVCKYYKEMS